MSTSGKVALITGAGRGIGATIGGRLLEAGFEVHFADANGDRASAHVASLDWL